VGNHWKLTIYSGAKRVTVITNLSREHMLELRRRALARGWSVIPEQQVFDTEVGDA